MAVRGRTRGTRHDRTFPARGCIGGCKWGEPNVEILAGVVVALTFILGFGNVWTLVLR
jgi:hypothetical protein